MIKISDTKVDREKEKRKKGYRTGNIDGEEKKAAFSVEGFVIKSHAFSVYVSFPIHLLPCIFCPNITGLKYYSILPTN